MMEGAARRLIHFLPQVGYQDLASKMGDKVVPEDSCVAQILLQHPLSVQDAAERSFASVREDTYSLTGFLFNIVKNLKEFTYGTAFPEHLPYLV